MTPFIGDTCSLWNDLWSGRVPAQAFPELFSFAKLKDISLSGAAAAQSLNTLFHLPLSESAFQQLIVLACDLQDAVFSEEKDVWSYIWGSFQFSSSKIYRHLIGSHNINVIFKKIWKTRCQHKHIVFFWLLLRDRLSTRGLLRRKGMDLPSYDCVLCSHHLEETQLHLFLDCPFAQRCWEILGLQIHDHDPLRIFESFINQLSVPFALDVIIIMSWCIWMARNDLIFKNMAASISSVRNRFKSEFALVVLRAKPSAQPALSSWLQALL